MMARNQGSFGDIMSESQAGGADAYAYYRMLRQNNPVAGGDGGMWQVSRHADVMQVLRDNQTFSSEVSIRPREERAPSMLFSDPPLHNRLRKLVSYAFKPSHIENQRAMISQRCDELMLAMCEHEDVDLVERLAAPLPVTVIAQMLGVEGGDMKTFKRWSDTIFSSIADILFAEPSETVQQAAAEMDAYFLTRIAALRADPQDHLLGRLVETETEQGHLTDAELLSFCRLLLIAGNETTTGLITGCVRVFDEMPETLAAVKRDPRLIPTFVEEVLRFYSPFSATVRRTTTETELAGVTIPSGALVVPLIASANRDETVFDDADRFMVARDPNPHVAFGYGIHNCLGAHLARLEGQIVVAAMARLLDSIEITESDQSQFNRLGGPDHLQVRIAAAASG
jgi:cytochrome P450